MDVTWRFFPSAGLQRILAKELHAHTLPRSSSFQSGLLVIHGSAVGRSHSYGNVLPKSQKRSAPGVVEHTKPAPFPERGASGSYVPLIASYAAISAFTAALPLESANLLFGPIPGGHGSAVVPMMCLLSTGFALACSMSFTLKKALEDEPISQQKFERLNLGLSAFATLNLLLLVTSLVSPEGSVQYSRPGFWVAGVLYLCTLSVSWGKYGKRTGLKETVKKTVPSLKAISEDVGNVVRKPVDDYFPNSYTIITLTLAAYGLAQLFVPWEILGLLLKNNGGDENELMARLVGCSLVTLLPATTYSLKEVARDAAIRRIPSKSLNVGLTISAVLNVAVLLPFLVQGKGGPMLGPYMLLWIATSATSSRNALLSSK